MVVKCDKCISWDECSLRGCVREFFSVGGDDLAEDLSGGPKRTSGLNMNDALVGDTVKVTEVTEMQKDIHEVVLCPAELSDIHAMVTACFISDKEMLEYSEASNSKALIERTRNLIKELYDQYGPVVNLMSVVYKGVHVGFSVFIDSPKDRLLYSFGIMPQYRKKEVLLGWVDSVKEVLGSVGVIALSTLNVRASNFFLRNGFKVKSVNNKIVLLCQS